MIQTSSVGIVLPPVWSHVFLPCARLLKYAVEDLGAGASIVEYDGELAHPLSIVLGWSLFERPFPRGSRYVLYQLEPLAQPLWRDRLQERRQLFEQAAAIWDYSQLNLARLGGLPARWVPLGFHPRLREVAATSDIPQHDVLFTGFVSPRRRAVLEQLGTRCLLSVQPRWGQDLLAALSSSKIVLNVHQYDGATPLEQPRVAHALNQGAFVLSETSADEPYPFLATAPYPELVSRVLHYLHHPSERRAERDAMSAAFAATSMTQTLRQALAAMAGV